MSEGQINTATQTTALCMMCFEVDKEPDKSDLRTRFCLWVSIGEGLI